MKMLGKILSVMFVLLILIFSILSVSGYSYYFGDNKVTVFKGIKDLKLSEDLGGGVKFTLDPVTADEIYFDAPIVVDIIKERAAAAGINDYRLYVQDSTGNVELVVPNDTNSEFGAFELASFLSCIGDVTIREGNSFQQYAVDTKGNSVFTDFYDTESETVIFDRNYITGAKNITRKVDGVTYHCLDIELNLEGAAFLSQFTDPTANSDASYYNSTVSFWLDDRMISYVTLSEHLTEGIITFTDESFTAEKTKLYAAIINADAMLLQPTHIQDAEYYQIPLIMITLIAGIVLVALAFVLIYRYKLCGGIALVSIFFQFAMLLAFCTGFFAKAGGIVMDTSAVCAFAFTLMLTIFSNVYVTEKIKKDFTQHKFAPATIHEQFKSCRALIFGINVIVLLVAFVGFFMFGTSGLAITLFGDSAISSIHKFSTVLLIGTALNFISGYILPEFFLLNFRNFKFAQKAEMFGGKKND